MLLLAVDQQPVTEGLLIVATIVALGWLWAPTTALLCDAAEGGGAGPVVAFALVNAGWAAGQLAGGAGAGALAQATTQHLPYLALGILFAGTLVAQMPRSGTRSGLSAAKRFSILHLSR